MAFKVGDKVMTKGEHPIYGKIADSPSPEGTAPVYACDLTGCHVRFIPTSALMIDYELNKWEADSPLLRGVCPEKETVAKPLRYNTGSIEVWDAIAQLGADYLQGNVIKYTMRYKHKNKAEDLKKAMNYLAKMLAEETGEDYYELRKRSLDEI
jgi:hypothetical protein